MEQYGAIRTRYSLSDNNNGGKQKKASITNYTWLLMADDRNRKEDVPILTHPLFYVCVKTYITFVATQTDLLLSLHF